MQRVYLPRWRGIMVNARMRFAAAVLFALLSAPALAAARVAENIGRMCFSPDGLLFREFDATSSEVFGRTSQSRGKVLRALLDGVPADGYFDFIVPAERLLQY